MAAHRELAQQYYCIEKITTANRQGNCTSFFKELSLLPEVSAHHKPVLYYPMDPNLAALIEEYYVSKNHSLKTTSEHHLTAHLWPFLRTIIENDPTLREKGKKRNGYLLRCFTELSDSHYAGIDENGISAEEPSVMHFKTPLAIERNLANYGVEGGAGQRFVFLDDGPFLPITYCLHGAPVPPHHIYSSLYDKSIVERLIQEGKVARQPRAPYLYAFQPRVLLEALVGCIALKNPYVSTETQARSILEYNRKFLARAKKSGR